MKAETKQAIKKAFSNEILEEFGYDFLEMMLPLQSFENACEIENLDASKVIPEFEFFPERDRNAMKAISRLVIITKAANRLANGGEEWIPDYNNRDEWKYENWFVMNDNEDGSSGFRSADYAAWFTLSTVGSRLCFISVKVGKFIAKMFLESYKEFFL